jgi:hypothetical protein
MNVIIKGIESRRMNNNCNTCGRDEKSVKSLVGKPEGKTQRERSRLRWKVNIKIGLCDRRCEMDSWGLNWAVANTAKKIRTS